MSRPAVTRFTLLALIVGIVALVLRALRGPAAPTFDTPSTTTGLLVPPGSATPSAPAKGAASASPPDRAATGPELAEPAEAADGPHPSSTAPVDSEAAIEADDQVGPDVEPGGPAGAAGTATAGDTPNPPGKRWAFPIDGECPPTHPIKAKLRSGIYHMPGMMAYDRARPDRCYSTEVDAQADGLRRAKR